MATSSAAAPDEPTTATWRRNEHGESTAMRIGAVAIVSRLTLVVAVLGGLTGCGEPGRTPHTPSSAAHLSDRDQRASSPRAVARRRRKSQPTHSSTERVACADSVGATLPSGMLGDPATVHAGPLSWPYLRSNERDFPAARAGRDRRYQGHKELALLAAGARVRVVIPAAERSTLSYHVTRRGLRSDNWYKISDGASTVLLRACRRTPSQFPGFFIVSQRRCAAIDIFVDGRPKPLRRYLPFGTRRGACRHRGDGRPGSSAVPHPPVALTVTPSVVHKHERVVVSITAAHATGVFGKSRHYYWVEAHPVRGRGGCVNNRDRGFPAGSAAGRRVSAALDPARGEGGPEGWCRGRFVGTVTYHEAYACPAVGRCRPPHGFPQRESVVARFSYRVR